MGKVNKTDIHPIGQNMSTMLTEEQFKACLPSQITSRINPQVIDNINKILDNPDEAEMLRDNILGFCSVMQEGKYSIEKYVLAVKYMSYRQLGDNKKTAYCKTFADKYAKWLADGVDPKDIASYITAYDKGQLITKLYTQVLTPLHIINMDKEQEAINHLYSLMKGARSENVQRQSATDLLAAIKRPETAKVEVELNLGTKNTSVIADLQLNMRQLAETQRDLIDSGAMNPKAIADAKLVVGETVE